MGRQARPDCQSCHIRRFGSACADGVQTFDSDIASPGAPTTTTHAYSFLFYSGTSYSMA